MYLHLGGSTVVKTNEIIGIFDLDTATVNKATKDFLSIAEKSGSVINVTYELPKSFIICEKEGKMTVYISQLATSTLLKRAETDGFIY